MSSVVAKEAWVWVVVENPGGKEQFLGQHDESGNISFLPTFLDKEAAQQGFLQLARNQKHKYEVQAILIEDLADQALVSGFMIFILDGNGTVLEKINPADRVAQ